MSFLGFLCLFVSFFLVTMVNNIKLCINNYYLLPLCVCLCMRAFRALAIEQLFAKSSARPFLSLIDWLVQVEKATRNHFTLIPEYAWKIRRK